MIPQPKDWRAHTLESFKEILAPSIKELGERKVIGLIGSQIAMAARIHDVEMRFNEDLLAIQVRRPIEQAPKLSNSLKELTAHEKKRLGQMLGWIFEGPEQGFCTNDNIREMKDELKDWCRDNGIPVFEAHDVKVKVVEPWSDNPGDYA